MDTLILCAKVADGPKAGDLLIKPCHKCSVELYIEPKNYIMSNVKPICKDCLRKENPEELDFGEPPEWMMEEIYKRGDFDKLLPFNLFKIYMKNNYARLAKEVVDNVK